MKMPDTSLIFLIIALNSIWSIYDCYDNEDNVLEYSNDVPFSHRDLNITSGLRRLQKRSLYTSTSPVPETLMDPCQILRYHHYPCEEYTIKTEDGFLITVHRVPYGKKGSEGNSKVKRYPVIIQHGFLCTSACWLFNIGDQNLPNFLADKGFDVWITNIRGNDYAMRHDRFDVTNKLFWKFSFQEMAQYDMPAMIDFILLKTGFKQLFYIGHSQGTTIPLAMLSTRVEYNRKIRTAFLLSPAASFKYSMAPFIKIFTSLPVVTILEHLAPGELLSPPILKLFRTLSVLLCASPASFVCTNILFWLSASNEDQLNATRLPVITNHLPARTSIHTLLHLIQIYLKDKMMMYDHGYHENMRIYGQAEPPAYNLSKVTVPISFFWGANDKWTDGRDITEILPTIRNLLSIYMVPDIKFHHLDFMWALNGKEVYFPELVRLMKLMSKTHRDEVF